MNRVIAAALSLGLLGGCQTIDEAAPQRLAQATLRQASGLPAGTAQVFSNGTEVTISIALAGITAGTHGIHLHAAGHCDAPAFTTAGPHLNPANRQHGHDNPAGAHLGDLPNVTTNAAGAGSVSAVVSGTPQEVMASLFDADGTAIVVHAGPDDYKTDPSGNSGARIACGVLTRL
ncbi:MAG: superoxide dismutase family protein [Croceibacterium sp.]